MAHTAAQQLKDSDELVLDEIGSSVVFCFERRVEKSPDRLAVKSRSHALTYRQLNQAANRVARAVLACRGPGEEPIAILCEQDVPNLVALLGILKAGKFYLSLAPSTPVVRNAYMLADSTAGLIVCDSRNMALARELGGQILNIDELSPDVSSENVEVHLTPDNKFHLVYTSGSTGQPKGILNNHRRLLHEVITYGDYLGLSTEDRFLQLYSLSFGAASKPVFASWLYGATLYLHDVKEQRLDDLAFWMHQEEVTVFAAITTTYRHFVSILADTEEFPRLRIISVGGEPLYKRDVDLHNKCFPASTLTIEMAASEAGKFLYYRLESGRHFDGDVVPAGYPMPGMQVWVADESGEPVGVGEVGEIAVKSRYLSLGYWRRPDLTAAAFRSDPSGGDARIYYTGDLGRMRPDGCIEHLGRKDSQVKIRGHRIEAAEIEIALLKHGAVKETAVVARGDAHGELRLVAYFVADRRPPPGGAELRRWLRQTLPDYMIPSAFIALEALPLTPHGKLDRLRLPAPDEIPKGAEVESGPPQDEVEARLVDIWAELFGVPVVSVKDDFFDLGGESLRAASLFVEIERMFGKRLPAATLAEAPTIEKLAQVIRRNRPLLDRSCLVPMQPRGAKPPLFLVHTFGGTVLDYRELASLLGPDQPIFGLQPAECSEKTPPLARVEDMAAAYIEVMHTVQPAGPYYLGGYCVAGWVAFEMARQLEALGEPVGLLAVFDGAAPVQARPRPPVWQPRFAIGFLRNLPGWLRDNLPGRHGEVLDRVRVHLKAQARAMWRALTGKTGVPDGEALVVDFLGYAPRVPERQGEMLAAHMLAYRTYQPHVYGGRLTLFRARALPLRLSYDPELDWGRLATGGVQIEVVPGHHRNILSKPQVGFLAAQLAASLAEAQTVGAASAGRPARRP